MGTSLHLSRGPFHRLGFIQKAFFSIPPPIFVAQSRTELGCPEATRTSTAALSSRDLASADSPGRRAIAVALRAFKWKFLTPQGTAHLQAPIREGSSWGFFSLHWLGSHLLLLRSPPQLPPTSQDPSTDDWLVCLLTPLLIPHTHHSLLACLLPHRTVNLWQQRPGVCHYCVLAPCKEPGPQLGQGMANYSLWTQCIPLRAFDWPAS